jgi:hypothetical protein
VVEGEPLAEGTKVAVVAFEDAETVEVNPEEEAILLRSIAEADREELVDLDDLLSQLGDRH